MSLKYEFDSFLKKEEWLIWILIPYVKTEDPNLQYYYDFSQSFTEYQKVCHELNVKFKWQKVEISNYKEIIQSIHKESYPSKPLVSNLCDGDEDNGVPGISVVEELENNQLIYTGSDRYFYEITTSKIPMKELFDKHHVPTAPWMIINPESYDAGVIFQSLKAPLIVKPAISAGSLGLGLRSVVQTIEELKEYLSTIVNGYRGWDFTNGGFFIEEYIEGEEYTTLIVGPSDCMEECIIYDPVERVFESSIPSTEQFLSFDRLWEIYEDESPLEQDKVLWNYSRPKSTLLEEIKSISWKAYKSVNGTGYGRVDLRRDKSSGKIMVLEVNAQCGISEDENYTSIGAVLRFQEKSFTELIYNIMNAAYMRHQKKELIHLSHKKSTIH
jgi:D-alanine-D-alanine ligase